MINIGMTIRAACAAFAMTFALAGDAAAQSGGRAQWTGFYVGGHIGGAWADSDTDVFRTSTSALENRTASSREGALGGVQIGYSALVGPQIVLGVEADVSAASLHNQGTRCGNNGCASLESKFQTLGTIRGRLGYAAGNWMAYVTAGGAWVDVETTRTITEAPAFPVLVGQASSADGIDWGWTIGAGIELAAATNWTVKLEYLHIGFETDRTYRYSLSGADRTNRTDHSIDLVRFGFNYRFNVDGRSDGPLK